MIDYKYSYIKTFDELKEFQKIIDEKNIFSFDTEGTSKDPRKNKLIGIGFSWAKYQAVYVPIQAWMPILGFMDYYEGHQQEAIEIIKSILLDERSVKVAHNGKYDQKCLFAEYGIAVKNFSIDTLLLLTLTKSDREKFSLDSVSDLYPDLKDYKDEVEDYRDKLFQLPLAKIALYNNRDTDLTYRAVMDNQDDLEDDEKLMFLYTEMLMPLSHLTARMEFNGYRIDPEAAKALHIELYNELKVLKNSILTETGARDFNIKSSDQLADILYTRLKLPILKRSKKTNKPLTGKAVLEKLYDQTKNETLKKIMEYRSTSANKGTFVDSFVKVADRIDNKEKAYLLDENFYYYGNYKLWSSTGRLRAGKDSDEDESGEEQKNSLQLQNIPRDVRKGSRYRKQFLPDEGHVLVESDFAQIELRILANNCKDPLLLKACIEDYDLHSFVGAMTAGVPYEEVLHHRKTKSDFKFWNGKTAEEIRDFSKNIGFGWIYGAQDGKFAYLFHGKNDKEKKQAELEAKELYFSTFARILPYKNNLINTAKDKGFIVTITGRKIYFNYSEPKVNSWGKKIDTDSHAERQIVNAAIQGPASDFVSLSAVRFQRWMDENDVDGRVVNLVHDASYESIVNDIEVLKFALTNKKLIFEEPKFGVIAKMKIDTSISDRWKGNHLYEEILN